MEAVQNSEERKVKNLKIGTVDPYARTLAVTQKALTLTQQEQIVKDLNFLTALEQEVTKKANKAKREYRQFATNEKTKRNLAAMVPIILLLEPSMNCQLSIILRLELQLFHLLMLVQSLFHQNLILISKGKKLKNIQRHAAI